MFKIIRTVLIVAIVLVAAGVDGYSFFKSNTPEARAARIEKDCQLRREQSAYWIRSTPGTRENFLVRAMDLQARTTGCW